LHGFQRSAACPTSSKFSFIDCAPGSSARRARHLDGLMRPRLRRFQLALAFSLAEAEDLVQGALICKL
jgi:hypothetical protein